MKKKLFNLIKKKQNLIKKKLSKEEAEKILKEHQKQEHDHDHE